MTNDEAFKVVDTLLTAMAKNGSIEFTRIDRNAIEQVLRVALDRVDPIVEE